MSVFYEPGEYVGEVTDQGIGQAKSTENYQFVLKLKILNGIDRTGPQPCRTELRAQYDRTVYETITEKTFNKLITALRNLGFQGDSFAQLEPNHPECFDLRGREIAVYCQHDQSQNGGMREQWRLTGGGSFEIKRAGSDAARKLDAMFGRALKAAPKTAPPVAAAPEPQVEVPAAPASAVPPALALPAQDDLPF